MKTIKQFVKEIDTDAAYVVVAKSDNNKPLYKTKDIRWLPNIKRAQKYKTFEGAQRFAVSYQRKIKQLNVNDIFITVKELDEL